MERPHWSEVARNIFNLIRDGGLFALIVALLFFPGPMVAQLQTAGVTHASALVNGEANSTVAVSPTW